ncbi:MAG: hypothetical protein KC492_12365, partial [Myxococcales bacterium]|nr:hypothetical protein [Myxococcales bacterium]
EQEKACPLPRVFVCDAMRHLAKAVGASLLLIGCGQPPLSAHDRTPPAAPPPPSAEAELPVAAEEAPRPLTPNDYRLRLIELKKRVQESGPSDLPRVGQPAFDQLVSLGNLTRLDDAAGLDERVSTAQGYLSVIPGLFPLYGRPDFRPEQIALTQLLLTLVSKTYGLSTAQVEGAPDSDDARKTHDQLVQMLLGTLGGALKMTREEAYSKADRQQLVALVAETVSNVGTTLPTEARASLRETLDGFLADAPSGLELISLTQARSSLGA